MLKCGMAGVGGSINSELPSVSSVHRQLAGLPHALPATLSRGTLRLLLFFGHVVLRTPLPVSLGHVVSPGSQLPLQQGAATTIVAANWRIPPQSLSCVNQSNRG